MPDHPAAVFVVDDDASVRATLKATLTAAGLLVETFSCAADFLAAIDGDRAGCLVLDIRLTGMSGPELQQRLDEHQAIVPIVFLTGHADVVLAVEAMQHGVVDFIQHPFRDCDLIERVGRALERDRNNRAALRLPAAIRERIERLGSSEREILARLTAGEPEPQIAHELGLSLRSVEIVRAQLMEKLSACSRGHLARLAAEAARATDATTAGAGRAP